MTLNPTAVAVAFLRRGTATIVPRFVPLREHPDLNGGRSTARAWLSVVTKRLPRNCEPKRFVLDDGTAGIPVRK